MFPVPVCCTLLCLLGYFVCVALLAADQLVIGAFSIAAIFFGACMCCCVCVTLAFVACTPSLYNQSWVIRSWSGDENEPPLSDFVKLVEQHTHVTERHHHPFQHDSTAKRLVPDVYRVRARKVRAHERCSMRFACADLRTRSLLTDTRCLHAGTPDADECRALGGEADKRL